MSIVYPKVPAARPRRRHDVRLTALSHKRTKLGLPDRYCSDSPFNKFPEVSLYTPFLSLFFCKSGIYFSFQFLSHGLYTKATELFSCVRMVGGNLNISYIYVNSVQKRFQKIKI